MIEKISGETRWAISTKAMTGTIMAHAMVMKDALGEEKFLDAFEKIWFEAGKGIKEIVDAFGLPVDNAKSIEEAMRLSALIAMGPEFESETVEATEDMVVVRFTKCPWHERWKELGLDYPYCNSGHTGYGNGAIEALNPAFTFKLTKNMTRGDPYCEHIIERK